MTGVKKPKPLLPPEEVAAVAEPKVKPRFQDRVAAFFGGIFKGIARLIPIGRLFATPEITVDIVNEQFELSKINSAVKRLTWNAIIIAVLGTLLAFGAPFFAPIYVYHTITPEGKITHIVPLNLPNLTNPAVVNWAAISTTEILSFGFGDLEEKTLLQKKRFTKDGWAAFVKAFLGTKIMESFQKGQMVMTTVPTDTPVIVKQGINEDGVYQWKVEVPIITTYAGNDNIIKPIPGMIVMTIVRVPPSENPAGIAIDIWSPVKH